MDELAQHITAIALASDRSESLPAGVRPLTALVAARTLMEMSEDSQRVRSDPGLCVLVQSAIEHADRAISELAR